MKKSARPFLIALLGAVLCITNHAFAAEDVPLKFGNTQVQDILTEYGRLIGKKVIADPTVQGRINLVTDMPVSREQAAALIEKALFLSDFTLLDASDDTVEVLGLGKIARNQRLPLYDKPEEIPAAERVFSYVIKLQHREPVAVMGFLSQIFPPTNIISTTADNASKTLVFTGPTSMVRKVIRLVETLDVSGAEEKPAPPKPSFQRQPGLN